MPSVPLLGLKAVSTAAHLHSARWDGSRCQPGGKGGREAGDPTRVCAGACEACGKAPVCMPRLPGVRGGGGWGPEAKRVQLFS